MANTYTEDHLVEQPAVQLMQDELGWEGEENIEHRTLNIEHRSVEKRKTWPNPSFQRLNPDLPVDHSSLKLRMAGAIEKLDCSKEALQKRIRIPNFPSVSW